MQFILRLLAVAMIATGIIWVLQGVGILPGSFMTGQQEWTIRGAFTAVGGVVVFLVAGMIGSRSR
jgi:hypothetical protein